MTNNSRSSWATAGVAICLSVSGAVAAAGLPLRPGLAPESRHAQALTGLADGLVFKLAYLDVGASNWAAAVEDVLLIARELGFPAQSAVTAQRLNGSFVVLIDGEGYVAGNEPDRVLGRLLYMLAHPTLGEAAQLPAAALAILDQPLSATLVALRFPPMS
jgi:hypothetical protein